VLLLVECVSFVLLSIVLSWEVLVDSCFLCDKVAVFGESAKRRADYRKDAEEYFVE